MNYYSYHINVHAELRSQSEALLPSWMGSQFEKLLESLELLGSVASSDIGYMCNRSV
jgi:hypothetical protein